MTDHTDLCKRLRDYGYPGDEAADALEILLGENKRLKQQLRDARDEDQSIATEAMWKERQGDEYGSY